MKRFPIRIGRWTAPFLVPFGVWRGNAYAEVDDTTFAARFGFYRVTTRLANITSWEISGPYRWITAIGIRRAVRPPHAATFGGSTHGGVRVEFREPLRWGLGLLHMPALYVTVDDLDGLAAELTRLGVPGSDIRAAS
ncbi:MAG: hypothetical protein ABIZ34_08830 [Candidatus Limnocylindrales bacterium]